MWTNHERKSAQARALKEKGAEYILPIQVDNSELPVRLKILEYVYKAKNLTQIHTPFSKYFFEKINQNL